MASITIRVSINEGEVIVNECPTLTIVDNTNFVNQTPKHRRQDFSYYSKYIITKPNGEVITYSSETGAANYILPPSLLPEPIEYSSDEIGIFSVTYKALPTGISGATYAVDDNFYYNGLFWKCLVAAAFTGVVNANYVNITEAEIASNYISNATKVNACKIENEFYKRIDALMCLILEQPTRKDLCDIKMFEEAIMLYNILYQLLYTITRINTTNIKQVKNMLNYANSTINDKAFNADC